MPTKIITKNGSGTPAASALDVGELAVDLTNKKLYSSTNGTDVVEIGVGAGFDAGAEATPSITFASDNDTGFWSGGTNAIALSSNANRIQWWEDFGTSCVSILGRTGTVGTLPNAADDAVEWNPEGSTVCYFWSGGRASYTAINFNGYGSITCAGSTTTYNTSSDYRLKDNVKDFDGALNIVKQLPTKQFTFKSDPNTTWHGFIAHELQEVYPNAVTGEKDDVREVGDYVLPNGKPVKKGMRKGKGDKVPKGVEFVTTSVEPVYQGVDHAKLVPLLVKAVQELTARLEALENPTP